MWTKGTLFRRLKEMQFDVDSIMKNNSQKFDDLGADNKKDLFVVRKATAERTRTIMKQYRNSDDMEIIDSEVANDSLESYRAYYAALDKYFGLDTLDKYFGSDLHALLAQLRSNSGGTQSRR